MPRKVLICFAVWVFTFLGRAAEPERSVVQIITFAQEPDWSAPWQFHAVQHLGGSGFVIKGKRIMTNAHVVSWARQIIVRRYQDPRPYVAKVEYVAHDCDLALLTVEDESFFDNLAPLEFGGLPKVRSTVTTCGYPVGGQEICYTRGVVSRIELLQYSHIGNRQFLEGQTDAAINPGNSGGPVFQEDRVVGVAFQGIRGLQNAGFFIPPPVIQRFLKDIEDGHYDGVPESGMHISALQNPAYRARLKLPDDDLGARVDTLLPIPATEQLIKPDDVLLRIGEHPVASDGTILYESNRVGCALVANLAQSGESIPLKIWRAGQVQDVTLPVYFYGKDRAGGNQYDAPPRYYINGGLVFTPLSYDYVKSLGDDWNSPGNRELVYELYYHPYENPADARSEPVVMAAVLPDAVNANVKAHGRLVLDKVNGRRIDRLEDVVRAFETNTNAYDVIEFAPDGVSESLDRAEVSKANPRLLKTYGIAKDRRL